MLRTHNCNELRTSDVGKHVTLCGWVDSWRDHGGVYFIDLRDRWGLTQVVFNEATSKDLYEQAKKLRVEFVVQVEGIIVARGPQAVNKKIVTGEIELSARSFTILNTSPTPPIEISSHANVSEDLRLKYRYLDLRRLDMQRNMYFRYKITKIARDFFDQLQFIEVETPYLNKSTPEGARDFLVPSRLTPGTFYALPQSPQLFKQILMVAGYDRYFQIVRCFRDEDLRADRQPEFTQIDLEMSFVDQEDVMQVIEGCVARVFKDMMNVDIGTIKRIPYDTAMNMYGSDKPDLRFGMPIVDVSAVFASTGFKVFKEALAMKNGVIKALRVEKGAQFSRKDIDDFTAHVGLFGAKGLAWIKVNDAGVLESQIVKFFNSDELERLKQTLSLAPGDIVFMVATEWTVACTALGALRLLLGKRLEMIKPNVFELCWVVDFPLVEWNEEEKRFDAKHHPFTSPRKEDMALLEKDPAAVKARAYDLVLNGTEVGGGSVRIHDEATQERIFALLGIKKEDAQLKFGFLLHALRYGAPPHAGFAIGLDRLVALLLGLDSIRDVIAFPKTQKGTCQMSDAPSVVDERQLRELSIRIRADKA